MKKKKRSECKYKLIRYLKKPVNLHSTRSTQCLVHPWLSGITTELNQGSSNRRWKASSSKRRDRHYTDYLPLTSIVREKKKNKSKSRNFRD